MRLFLITDTESNKGTLAPKETEDVLAAVTEESELSGRNHSILYAKLAEHSNKWRDIGTYLGFRPTELDNIHARPLLLHNAPNSWLNAMLSEWLQWAPGDQRGSTNCATLEGLNDALNKAGLSEVAESITAVILKPTA